ncbi:hypothetical protein WDB89_00225 [Pseudoalteromonas sp. B5MOD-1]|uniref:hypothetical protein n=1 Tax=Pseudoalteromonas TaxID=53246 RepID=UPI0007850B2E|nr:MULTISPECIES: hypothetical protein [Pseudoalteromonas]MCO7205027.1 hypothetical protein [Pseudoalteromonas sp. CnMc7-37]
MQNFDFINSDLISIFSACVGVLSIAVAIYFARKTHNYQKQIAESQGVFKKGDIKLSIFNLDKDLNGGFLDYLFIAGPIRKDTISYLPFPIQVTNEGSKSVNDIEVMTRIHRSLRVVNSQDMGVKLSSTVKNIRYSYNDSGNHQISSLYIDSINPKLSVNFEDGFLLKDALPIFMDIKNEINLSFHFIASTQLTMNLYMKDEEPIMRNLKVVVIDTSESTLKHQLNQYNKAMEQSYKKPSFFKWLLGSKNNIKKFTLLEFDKESYLDSNSGLSKIDLTSVNATSGFFNINGTIHSHYQWNK